MQFVFTKKIPSQGFEIELIFKADALKVKGKWQVEDFNLHSIQCPADVGTVMCSDMDLDANEYVDTYYDLLLELAQETCAKKTSSDSENT